MAFFRTLLPMLLFSLSIAVALPGAVCYPQEQGNFRSFEAEGIGTIKAGDLSRARQDAIQDALRGAVARAVAGKLSEAEAKKAAKILRDTIYADAERYVQTYRITGEYPGHTAYKVVLRATIAEDGILRDLAALGILGEQVGSTPAAEVIVAVKGLASCRDYMKFWELLKNGPKGLLRIQPRLVAWRQAEFAVTLRGTVQSLAGDLKETGQFTLVRIDAGHRRIEGMISGERIR